MYNQRSVRRGWRPLALLALLVVAPVCWVFALRLTAVGDGTTTYPAAPPWTSSGAVIAQVHGQPGDLRPEDRVVAVDGVPLETWVADRPDREFRDGERLTYRIERGQPPTVVDVEVTVQRYPIGAAARAHVAAVPILVLMIGVGMFVFLSRPDDRAARALFGVAALAPFTATAWPLGTQIIDLANGPRVWPFLLGDLVTAVVWGGLLHFALVLPEARGLLARRPWIVVAAYAMPFALHLGFLAATLPAAVGALDRLGCLVPVSVVAAHVFPFLIPAVLIAQYRAVSDPVGRRSLRWVLGTLTGIAVLYLGLGQIPDRLLGRPLLPWDALTVIFTPFPIVLGAAVLRYRLFDIQVVIRRSLVYGSLATVMAGLFLATVALLGQVSGSPVELAQIVAIVVVALLFQPLQNRVRRAVGRLVFGARDDPSEVLTDLGRRLEATAAPESILTATVQTLARTLRLSYVAIELAGPSDPAGPAASIGRPSGAEVSIPLLHGAEEIGHLVLDAGPSREPFGPADSALLDALARQIAVTAHNVLLTAQLQRSLEQVVTTREEERRRLRRDIHDGVGPTLAAGALHVEVARNLLRRDPDAAEEILSTLAQTQQKLIADIRRLVEGLRPPVLDQLGLVRALQQRALAFTDGAAPYALRVEVTADDHLEPLPAAAEVAAYHIVLEALTNVAKHARATRCTVRLWRDGALHLEVRDDGCGLPEPYRAGVGLTSIRERASELGGTAVITAAPSGGTRVRADLPLPPPEHGG